MLTVGITCRAPDSLENGTIGYSSLVTTEPFSYETTATYRCDPGYDITGGNNERTCTGDGSTPSGQWNGAAPQCPRMFYYMVFDHMILYTTAVDCGTPPSITNGSPGIPTTTKFTGTVTYSCNDGYALFGIATSTCQANTTWSRPPECSGTCEHSLLTT